MSWKKLYSIEKLIDEGKRIAETCSVISFDLFDTLFIRRIHDPDLVKHPVARFISDRAALHGIEISWEAVQRLRDTIEKKQREETGKNFDDHEAFYPIFMDNLLQSVFEDHYSDKLLEDVTQYELEMESSMLVPRSQFIDWMAELHSSGKRIFIISDIYLPAKHLKILVERGGFLKYAEEVVSSADSFLAKASGKAFPLIQKRFGLDTSSWLHIGDNPHSDGMRAGEYGLHALVLLDGSEKHRKALMKRYVNYSKGRPFYRGRALQQLMLPHEGENVPRTALYIEGYNFLGPMIGAFIQHIGEESRRLGLTKIFFLSREGYTFKKVWEESVGLLFPDKNLPEIEYLYVSRMALAGASCAHNGLTREHITIAFLPPGNRDFHDLARIYKLDISRLATYFNRFGISADTCLTPRHDGFDKESYIQFMKMIDDDRFQEEIKNQTQKSNKALIRYLEDLNFFNHEQVGIVDIGWLGTIQRFFYHAVKHRDDCPRLHGYLFGATRGIDYPTELKNSIEGVVYDRSRFDLAASCILYARDVFEEACRAPHPTLDGYELDNDGYKLLFRREDDAIGVAEKEQDRYFAPLQQGIVDAAKRFSAASALLGYHFSDYRPWFNYVIATKLAFPKSSEMMEIRHKHHLDDFHGGHKTKLTKAEAPTQLWDASFLSLRLNPLLRFKFFWRHIKDVLRN